MDENFYPRPPRGGRPRPTVVFAHEPLISIHALREEGDSAATASALGVSQFLSTPSARRATSNGASEHHAPSYFYPRPPRGGRRTGDATVNYTDDISIHALREEGDIFCPVDSSETCYISIHALREEGDYQPDNASHTVTDISIHALREEGDGGFYYFSLFPSVFLSTPSARRATMRWPYSGSVMSISIHALREEGDACCPVRRWASRISIHALREEGD